MSWERVMRLHRMSMLAAGGVGYVLGAKAGHGRYEQIRHAMQEAPHATEVAKEKVMAAADKVRHATGGTHKDPFAVDPMDEMDPMEPESYDSPSVSQAGITAMPGAGPAAPTYGGEWKGDTDPDTRP